MDRERVRAAFEEPKEFTTSPLYRCLGRTVAATDQLLDLACQGRPGQYPTFLFFGAVHLLLLAGTDHPLARFYPSIAGERALPPEGAGPALVSFGREHAAELAETIRTRLVQTNQVQRAIGLRLGLSVIADEVPGPVHVIEAGTSAGLNLRFDRYGYQLNGRQFGDPASPVQLAAECHGQETEPDLDHQPPIASVLGIDLHPVDATDPGERAWLQALVWPENHRQRALLTTALELAAADPPPILAGDVIDVLPRIAGALPAGQPRVVFHSATRLHVPAGRLAAFDAAIERAGDTGPLWWLSIEDAPAAQSGPRTARRGPALQLRRPGTTAAETIAIVDGHLAWIEMRRTRPHLCTLIVTYPSGYNRVMDAVLQALSDEGRRTMLEALAREPATAGELAALLPIARPGASRHLRVLREAGLVEVRQEAQRRVYSLRPEPLAEIDAWLGRYRALWEQRLDALHTEIARGKRERRSTR